MLEVSRTLAVPHSTKQMFELVNDVQSYPEFIPGCINSRILEFTSEEVMVAIDIWRIGSSQTFITQNTLIDNQRISIRLINGPFKKLMGDWMFFPLDSNTCVVKFYLNLEFSNKFMEFGFSSILKELTSNMVKVFATRAEEVYSIAKN